jgi:hypothetical protein
MAKTYVEELAEWIQKRKSGRDKNLVAFRSVESDVKEALEAGFSVKTIWCNLHEAEQVTCGYETFLNLVNRHIRAKPPAKNKPKALNQHAKDGREKNKPEAKEGGLAAPNSAKSPAQPGFTWNKSIKNDELF